MTRKFSEMRQLFPSSTFEVEGIVVYEAFYLQVPVLRVTDSVHVGLAKEFSLQYHLNNRHSESTGEE